MKKHTPGFSRGRILLSSIALLGLAACSYPRPTAPGFPPAKEVTQAYQTVGAQLTLTLARPQTGSAPNSTSTPPPWATNPQPALADVGTGASQTRLPEIQSTPTTPCDRAAPGNPMDITVPDDTQMQPGETFSKIWRMQNTGACPWTRDYAVVWFSGEAFDAPGAHYFSSPVLPGQFIDVVIDMRAPKQAGVFQSNWKLRSADGTLFGIGPNGSAPFWVRIVVVAPPPPPQTATPTQSATNAVAINGTASLQPKDYLDLDTNQKNTASNDKADLFYQVNQDKQHSLVPQNNGRLGIPTADQPSLEDCEALPGDGLPISLDNLPAGSFFCYRTNQGLSGWGRLVVFNPLDGTLGLEILTWATP